MEEGNKVEGLQLELSTCCYSSCVMCPRDKLKRRIGTMGKEFAFNVIDFAISLGAKMIKLEWFGETLIVPYWDRVARYAKHRGMRVVLITNGYLLNAKNKKYVLNYVDKIIISIDSSDSRIYEKIRKGLKFKVVDSNIRALFKERNIRHSKTKIIIAIVKTDFNKDNLKETIEYFKQFSDGVVVNEDIDIEWDNIKREVKCKHNVYTRLIIGWNGKCYLCCHDWIGEYEIGDLSEQTMEDIWNGEKRKGLLNKLDELEICQKCMLLLER